MFTLTVLTAASVHIGVNSSPWGRNHGLGKLRGAENDARSMDAVAAAAGIGERTLLVGENATRSGVVATLTNRASSLAPGGFLLATLSGHGIDLGRGGAFDERIDQGFVAHNGPVCDDCVSDALSHAPADSEILLVIDACHADGLVAIQEYPDPSADLVQSCTGCRASIIAASVLVLAASSDDETTDDGATNGAFTAAIVDVWQRGAFRGDYDAFYAQLRAKLERPEPILRFYRHRENPGFRTSRPFTPPRGER